MVIYRTPELVSITPSVIAINNSTRIRLRCIWSPYAVGNGMTEERSSVILERYIEKVYHNLEGHEVLRQLEWSADETTQILPTEQRIEGIRECMGTSFSYAEVYSISQLKDIAKKEGLIWCARERLSN